VVTQQQLEAEPWWGRETVTSPMIGLGLQLRAAYGVGATAFGIKGNTAHLSGGHRSQEWLKNSAYCTNRIYSVQSGLTAAQARMCVAFDFTPGAWGTADNRAKMIVLTRRLIDAQKAGLLDELDEVFGTVDGKTVTGWNNDADRSVSADSSHLDHIHGRFDRRFADDNAVMAKVAAIMLGEEDDMTTAQEVWTHDLADDVGGVKRVDPAYHVLLRADAQSAAAAVAAKAATDAVVALNAKIGAISAVDPAAVAAALAQNPAFAAAFAAELKSALTDPEVVSVYAQAAAEAVHEDLAD